MKKRSAISLLILTLCLLLGLSAPFLSTLLQDLHPSSRRPLGDDTVHYAYQGTLINRVLAFNAYLNNSPAIDEIIREESSCENALSLWTDLCSFLPISGEYTVQCENFTLAPKQYNAQYRYTQLEYHQEDLTLSAVVDAESSIPLRIELKCRPELLTDLLSQTDTWTLLRQYTALLGLGEAADVYYSKSEIIVSRSAPIRGTSYFSEMTAMPSAGMLLFKLTAASE